MTGNAGSWLEWPRLAWRWREKERWASALDRTLAACLGRDLQDFLTSAFTAEPKRSCLLVGLRVLRNQSEIRRKKKNYFSLSPSN